MADSRGPAKDGYGRLYLPYHSLISYLTILYFIALSMNVISECHVVNKPTTLRIQNTVHYSVSGGSIALSKLLGDARPQFWRGQLTLLAPLYFHPPSISSSRPIT